MPLAQINEEEVEIQLGAEAGKAVLLRENGQHITLTEDGDICPELRRGELPEKLLEFLKIIFQNQDFMIEELRVATACQLWDEYAHGPNGGWRAAGKTNVPDRNHFAMVLGKANLTVFLDGDGGPVMVEVWWENTELFDGHSILTHVFDPENWAQFDATIFG